MCIRDRLDGSTNGVQLTQHALTNEIGPSGAIFVAVALFFFAFSSILGNYYYGEANVRYLTPVSYTHLPSDFRRACR